MIYLDNAATTWPKPKEVKEAILHFMDNVGANPGRSTHKLSIDAERLIFQTRENVAELFNVKDPLRIVFGMNATDSLNLAIRGLLRPGEHVITSSIEHNSVMRPLNDLEKKGVEVSVVQCSSDGFLNPVEVEKKIKKNTCMIVINHASNVVGSIQNISAVGEIAKKNNILFLVDAAQTAGIIPIDMEKDKIDLLAFTGHKSLYGPQGTGGLVIGERVNIKGFIPLKTGGTGSNSMNETQPDFLPDLFESGTPNTLGLVGLNAGVEFILKLGINKIRQYEIDLTRHLIEGLKKILEVAVYGGGIPENQTATVSFNIKNIPPDEVGLLLDEKYEIMTRIGLHCSPRTHKTIGTFPDGTVRLSISYFNKLEEIDEAIKAIGSIAIK